MDLAVTECLVGSDGEMLCFALDRARKEFAYKTGGLTAGQLRRRQPPSTMTVAGLIKHLTLVEESFTARALGREQPSDGDVQMVSEWESALTDEPHDLYAGWYGAVERSRTAWAELITGNGHDVVVEDPDPAWNKNRRRILVDLLLCEISKTGEGLARRGDLPALQGFAHGRFGS